MLSNATPVCFVSTADGNKARPFYEDVLGLKCLSDDEYAIVFDLGGVVLRVQKFPGYLPQDQTVHGWRVDDIDSEIRRLSDKGVIFERFPCFEQSDLGVWDADGAKVAWFKDPDGNLLSLSEIQSGA